MATLPLKVLSLRNAHFSDLNGLRGTRIEDLDLTDAHIDNLAPLEGLPLRRLLVQENPIADLGPLQNMPLEELYIGETKVLDVSPLAGLPLKRLHMAELADGVDVSPLAAIETLEELRLSKGARGVNALRMLPRLKYISFELDSATGRPRNTAEEFWAIKDPASESSLAAEKRFEDLEMMLRQRMETRASTDMVKDLVDLAVVLVAGRKYDEYRKICKVMLERWRERHIHLTLLVCCLSSESGIDQEAIHQLGNSAFDGWEQWLAAYREGESEELKRLLLRDSQKAEGFTVVLWHALSGIVEANLGDHLAAAGEMSYGRDLLRRELERGYDRYSWRNLLATILLFQEIEGAVQNARSPDEARR